MDWNEKFAVVEACLEVNEEIEQDFYLQPSGVSADGLSSLQAEFPFVSDDYLRFLQRTNGADIAQCRFVEVERIPAAIEQYGDVYLPKRWLPFGYDAGGDPLLLHESGQVALGDGTSSSETFEFLADTFADFLENVLMGQRYGAIFRIPLDEQITFYEEELDDDPWLAFLVEQTWLRIS
ncbi:SMI1/KNR4 family protein [Bremerella cremea]|uniref:SMI1/KNR4 family protein n=1 Tax=Bremerella cremea TaxID=1031537 RepID=UPI0031E69552